MVAARSLVTTGSVRLQPDRVHWIIEGQARRGEERPERPERGEGCGCGESERGAVSERVSGRVGGKEDQEHPGGRQGDRGE